MKNDYNKLIKKLYSVPKLYINEFKNYKDDIYFWPKIIDNYNSKKIWFLNQTFKFHSCGAVGLNQLTIKPNGDVCICQGDSRSYKNIAGNIIKDEIIDILNNPINDNWLKMYTIDKKECKYCPALSVCGGGCPLQAEALFGNRTSLDEASCIYYKKLLEWLIKQYFYVTMKEN